jgi:enoyl-CoA hydratase
MTYEDIILEREGTLAILTLNRPKVLNALTFNMLTEIKGVVEELDDEAEVRVLIITGAGDRSFCAGSDVNELDQIGPEKATAYMRLGQQTFRAIEEMGKPVIAAVNGYALGGGSELAQACDLRVAAESAKFGQLEINLGNIPGWGGTQRLPRLVGAARAKEMIYTGEMIDAQEAYRIGLVNSVVPDGELMGAAKDLAEKIATKGPIALRIAKWAIDRGLDGSLATGLEYEKLGVAFCTTTEDQLEGTSAFKERRPPEFKGR